MTSHGVLCSRSCLTATGRTTSRANLRQRSWNSSCSSLSLKSTVSSASVHDAIDWSVNLSKAYVTHAADASTAHAVRGRWLWWVGSASGDGPVRASRPAGGGLPGRRDARGLQPRQRLEPPAAARRQVERY